MGEGDCAVSRGGTGDERANTDNEDDDSGGGDDDGKRKEGGDGKRRGDERREKKTVLSLTAATVCAFYSTSFISFIRIS